MISHAKQSIEANLKNIFVSPYPTLFYCYWLVGRKIIFLTSQIGHPLNLIVYNKTCLKRPLKKKIKQFFLSRPIIAYCRSKVLQNVRPSFNLQVLLYSPTIGNKIKYTNNLLRISYKDNTVYIGQFSKFAMKLKKIILT